MSMSAKDRLGLWRERMRQQIDLEDAMRGQHDDYFKATDRVLWAVRGDQRMTNRSEAMEPNTIKINEFEYVRADKKPAGNRAVVVVDRGWIFAGDMTRKDGRIILTNAVWVFRWSSIGFDGVIRDPKKAEIRKIDDVDIPAHAEVFCVPVSEKWGL